jgi:filamentous hemagglutinin family protein
MTAFEEACSAMTRNQPCWQQPFRFVDWADRVDRTAKTTDSQGIFQSRHWRSHLTSWLLIGGVIFVSPLGAIAQLQPIADDTLGNERSLVTPATPTINLIEGGAQRGANLFHSFREFSIDNGRGVYFTNPAGVANILTRVTGNSRSEILGTLGVLGTANLFLLNPNGILFGPGAQLNIRGGSFVASTANSIVFKNDFAFSATNPQAPPLLTVNVPIGLQYGSNPGAIRSQGAILQVPDGQTLTLAGGAVNIDGGQLLAPGGRVELGGVSAAGTVGWNRDGSLSFPNNVARADVSSISAAKVDVSAGGGGSITISARNLEVREGSQLLVGIREGLGTPEAQAGDITIDATDLVRFDGEDQEGNDSGAFSTVESRAEGNSGSVLIKTRFLEVLNGALLDASTFGIGNAGRVTINATDWVRFDGAGIDGLESGARSEVVFDETGKAAVGTAGGVSITTKILEALHGAQISTSTNGIGNAGRVTINATDLVRFDGEDEEQSPSGAFSNVNRGAVGNAGGVSITTGSLEVLNGATLSASTFGKGNAGRVTINATDLVRFDGETNDGYSSAAYSQVTSGGVGNAGGVSITTDTLEVLDGGEIAANTFGIGNGGSVTINATGLVKFEGQNKAGFSSAAYSQVNFSNIRDAPAEGNAGGIFITAGSLEVLNGAQLNASTNGIGNAGRITINATDLVKFDGVGKEDRFPSQAFSGVDSQGVGTAGGLSITTSVLKVTNGGHISASTLGKGNAGNIEISANTYESSNSGQIISRTSNQFPAGNIILNVENNITLSGTDTGIFASTTQGSTGRGGSIIIDPRTLIIQDGATISTNSQGEGIGGDIEITAGFLTLDRGTISAETLSNTGGNITLNLQDLLLLRNGSQISTTAGNAQFGGDGGNITFNGKFIVAVPKENSDISANAYTGNGGRVDVTAQGIFGTQFRPQLTPLSDITASSSFGAPGVVAINTPDVDPNRGLVQLPTDITDASRLIAQTCPTGNTTAKQPNEFIVTGRGGLPPTPSEAVNRDAIQVDLVTANAEEQQSISPNQPDQTSSPRTTPPTRLTHAPLVEAQSWQLGTDGRVVLVAAAPTNAIAPSPNRPVYCP